MLQNGLLCPICKDVYNIPKVLPCLHVYCYPCILGQITHSRNNSELRQAAIDLPSLEATPFECSICKRPCYLNDTRDVCYNLKNRLDELDIACEFEGCDKQVKLGDLRKHELNCENNPQREVHCPDCDIKLREFDLKHSHRCQEGRLKRLQGMKITADKIMNEIEKQKKMLQTRD